MDPEIKAILASTRLRLDDARYVILCLPPDRWGVLEMLHDSEPFTSITLEREEVSVVLREEKWIALKEKMPEAMVEGPYRLITFDIVLDLSIVGFMAAVSAELAQEGVSIFPLSTFLRDHILVRDADAERAVRRLEKLIAGATPPING